MPSATVAPMLRQVHKRVAPATLRCLHYRGVIRTSSSSSSFSSSSSSSSSSSPSTPDPSLSAQSAADTNASGAAPPRKQRRARPSAARLAQLAGLEPEAGERTTTTTAPAAGTTGYDAGASAGPPTRHAIPFTSDEYYDAGKLDAELRRVFDVCHGCRRCHNLCASFPTLFDLIDGAQPDGELEQVDSAAFASVVDQCTLCDMCFMAKCPYVPPHPFNIDFPNLMLRYRAAGNASDNRRRAARLVGRSAGTAVEAQQSSSSGGDAMPDKPVGRRGGRVLPLHKTPWTDAVLTEVDTNAFLASFMPSAVNWATRTDRVIARSLLERMLGVHRRAALPEYVARKETLMHVHASVPAAVNADAPAAASQRKVVLFATCLGNWNDPQIGLAARAVLAHNGVHVDLAYPGCCGMPQFEQGKVARVAEAAERHAAAMVSWLDRGYRVVSLVPSCSLMIKTEWPLLLPNNTDVTRLAAGTSDICEYIMDIADTEGLVPGLHPLPGGVTLHFACHARALNIGAKARDMLRRIPDTHVTMIERCSGHGGSLGVKKQFFETALRVGKPVARAAARTVHQKQALLLSSECPLAGEHVRQGMQYVDAGGDTDTAGITLKARHPVELLAASYGIQAGRLPPSP